METLPQTESAQLVLATAIEQRAKACLQELTQTGELKMGRVHRLRVATRRLRVALKLANAQSNIVPRKLERHLRRLLNVLSPLRDAQLQRNALKRGPSEQPELQSLRKQLRQRQRRLAHKAAKVVAHFDTAGLEQAIAEIQTSLRASSDETSTALLGQISQAELELLRRRRSVEASDMRSVHRLRIGVKNVRYALEALGPSLNDAATERIADLARIQSGLGELHDEHLFAEQLAKHADGGRADRPRRLRRYVRELRLRNLERAREAVVTLRQRD